MEIKLSIKWFWIILPDFLLTIVRSFFVKIRLNHLKDFIRIC